MARHWHHRDRGVDAGDVFAGLLIIGGIAAVASAASKANRDKRSREARDYRYPDDRYPDRRNPEYRAPTDGDYRDWREHNDRAGGYGAPRSEESYRGGADWRGASGAMDASVSACTGEIERGNRRVDTVDGVNRESEGWRVTGKLRDGRSYSCTAGPDGRIRNLSVDGRGII